MKEYIDYFRYVMLHKWEMFKVCAKHGFIWRGLVHDLSKLLPDEFFPYAKMFYDNTITGKDKKAYAKMNARFEYAWLKHIHRNKHHPQYWILPQNDGSVHITGKVLDIPELYVKEMVFDWVAASIAQKTGLRADQWYENHKRVLPLSKNTRKRVESFLKELFGDGTHAHFDGC
jgi:hypothetical protein